MQKITRWTAKRSGRSITVAGTNEEGVDVRIVDVEQIERSSPEQPTIATTKYGTQFNLA